jgi:hypothetical protein
MSGMVKVQIWNVVTREWVESEADILPLPRKPQKSYSLGPFVRVGQTFARLMASGGYDLPASSHKLLWWMLGSADYDNTLRFTRSEMARSLGWAPQNLSRALKPLLGTFIREAKLRTPGKLPGDFNESRAFVLSPWMFSRGDDTENLQRQRYWGVNDSLPELVRQVATRAAMKVHPHQVVLPPKGKRVSNSTSPASP